jgi:site-specific recombinase XerD
MVNQLFTLPNTIQRLRQGPLNEHLDSYANLVAEQGYALNSIRSQIVVIADLSRWLQQKNIAVVNLDGNVVARFFKVHGRQDGIRRGDACALNRFLSWLRQTGLSGPNQNGP